MLLIGLDPGSQATALVVYSTIVGRPDYRATLPNDHVPAVLAGLYMPAIKALVIEQSKGYTLPGGRSGRFVPEQILETCEWIGYFRRCWGELGGRTEKLDRRDVKLHLLGRASGTDAQIREALLDLVGPRGTKSDPGPTYGIKADQWAALAVAFVWAETHT